LNRPLDFSARSGEGLKQQIHEATEN
jgi:hypothetical protein